MMDAHPAPDVLRTLVQWAEQRDSIRAMLLTSTRAVPNATVDEFSDYDVILVVRDIHPFYDDRAWLEDFGRTLVVYWDPIHVMPEYGIEKVANVTQYEDGLKIDFTLWPVELMRRIAQAPTLLDELDAGYAVLLDKDGLTAGMPAPSYRAHIPARPSAEAFQKWIEDFFSDAPYVAKCLRRGELLPAKWCLDYDMKHVYLRPMLEWLVEIEHDWAVPVGWLGKGLRKGLRKGRPPDIWSQLELSYAGGGMAENWEALYRTMELFRRVAVEVAAHLGYTYPHELDRRVNAYVRRVQHLDGPYEYWLP